MCWFPLQEANTIMNSSIIKFYHALFNDVINKTIIISIIQIKLSITKVPFHWEGIHLSSNTPVCFQSFFRYSKRNSFNSLWTKLSLKLEVEKEGMVVLALKDFRTFYRFSFLAPTHRMLHRPGKKRPSGGGGGRGGSVFLVADKNVTSLNFPTTHYNAPDGKNGGSKFLFPC